MDVYNDYSEEESDNDNNYRGGQNIKEESFSDVSSESDSYVSSNTDNEGIEYSDDSDESYDSDNRPLKRKPAKKTPKKKVIQEAMTCPLCKEQFKSVSACQRHKKVVHLFGVYNCELCSAEFPLAEEYVTHTQTHHTEVALLACTSCGESFELDWYQNHLK